eukprot:TRINITY_DN7392_c0_g1_i2.p1 TRINITY_DN7392_c0_g1~~TRINITY_DN7392_c0_g1_i2.p1  ORF type:complete len:131 (+),score=49.51 TRINITY_DN7392_c0_g1_i2:83-475(+)
MAWQQYVDETLCGGGKVDQGALLGTDGSIWAKSASLNLSQEEATAIAGGMGEASGDYFKSSGIYIAGEKYMCLRFDNEEGLLYGKKGPAGCTIARSGQCLVIGVYGEGKVAGDCNVATEGLKDYLISVGY